jgi:hypothetical protein
MPTLKIRWSPSNFQGPFYGFLYKNGMLILDNLHFKRPVKQWLEILNSQDVPNEDWRKAALRGGFPAAVVGH